jgi:SAM-dependent methyltransferase
MNDDLTAINWDSAYKKGKYAQEAPIALVHEIIDTVSDLGLVDKRGYYPGCGNGRNYVPLLDAGLLIDGDDISSIAINQLKALRPKAPVTVGDFLTHETNFLYDYLISIQLFQHGTSDIVKKLFKKAHELLAPQGLFILRVNSIHTQIIEKYDKTESLANGSFTIRYHTGQKAGQDIHFYSAEELCGILSHSYKVILPLREEFIERADGTKWVQWETIAQKIG